jgi:hypothetical protein
MVPCTVAGNSRPPWWCPSQEPTSVAATPTACSGTWKRDLGQRDLLRTYLDSPSTMPMGNRMAHTNVCTAIWRQWRPPPAHVGVHDPVDGNLRVDILGGMVPVRERWGQQSQTVAYRGGGARGARRVRRAWCSHGCGGCLRRRSASGQVLDEACSVTDGGESECEEAEKTRARSGRGPRSCCGGDVVQPGCPVANGPAFRPP